MLARKSVQEINLFHDCKPIVHAPSLSGSSLQLLGTFPKLHSINIHTDFFNIQQEINLARGVDEYYFPTPTSYTVQINRRRNTRFDALYARDALLKTIPASTFARLAALRTRTRHFRYSAGLTQLTILDESAMWAIADVLPYARDLQAKRRELMPIRSILDSSHTEAEEGWNQKLCDEAKAAAYFDPAYAPPETHPEERLYQWCARTIEGGNKFCLEEYTAMAMGQQVVPKLKPRSFDELFEFVDGEMKVRDEHSMRRYSEAHF